MPRVRVPILKAKKNCQFINMLSELFTTAIPSSALLPSLPIDPEDNPLLIKAKEKGYTFLAFDISEKSITPNYITIKELTCLYQYERELAETILNKIYSLLSLFNTREYQNIENL